MSATVVAGSRSVEVGRHKVLTTNVMPARACEFISNQVRAEVVPGANQNAVELLIGTPNVVPILVITRRAGIRRRGGISSVKCHIDRLAILRVIIRDGRAVHRFDGVARIGRVYPNISVVVEIRVHSLDVHIRPRAQVVVDSRIEAVAGAVIRIGTLVLGGELRNRLSRRGIGRGSGRWFEIVDPAVILIPRPSEQETKFPLSTEALAIRTVELAQRAAALDRCVSPGPSEIEG